LNGAVQESFVYVISGDVHEKEEFLGWADHFKQDIKKFSQLAKQVLDLAKVESGNITLNLQPINVVNLIEGMEGIFQSVADEYGIRLSTALDPSMMLTARADKTRLKQVLLNLVSNAIKYNRKEGNVTVACKPLNQKTLQIDVIDTGPGISAEDQDKLFEPFNRLGNEHSDVEGRGHRPYCNQRVGRTDGGGAL
jgi:signal transduction histidine kinase